VKVALAIAPHDAQPSAFVVFRDRLDISMEKVFRLGYDGVELALATAGDVDPGYVRRLLDDNCLGLSAISTGRVFAEQHVWLTNADPAIRRRALEILTDLIDLAAELGATRVNIGRVRGFIADGESREIAERRFFEGLGRCAQHAAPHSINIVLEPVNRYEINYVNSVWPDGVDVVSRLGHPNVKLMPDVFHMNIEDACIPGSLERAGQMIGYVHLADSNRWAPGWGHTDFGRILDALARVGYDDYVAVEILPIRPPTRRPTRRSATCAPSSRGSPPDPASPRDGRHRHQRAALDCGRYRRRRRRAAGGHLPGPAGTCRH
jgi:sugar phosphate isomerase/epimerase